MKNYSEKLKHPNWQMKRLEIFKRDNVTCQHCGSKENSLNVHHIAYSGDPWEAPNELLITLCQDCHQVEQEAVKQASAELANSLKRLGFMSVGLCSIKEIFSAKDRGWKDYEPAFSILAMVVEDDTLWKEMSTLFWERLNKIRKHTNG